MGRALVAILSTALAVHASAPASHAAPHGGNYRGPSPTGPSGPAPASPGSAPRSGDGFNDAPDDGAWSRWWEFNREPYLDLKASVHARGGPLSPRGRAGDAGPPDPRDSLAPHAATVHDRVVPALVAALERERDVDIVTGSLLALAKIGDRPGDEIDLAAVLRPFLSHANQEVQETAVVALGVLGSPAAAPLLAALAEDAPEGRQAVGGGRVALRTRAFATYGLGLFGASSKRAAERRFTVYHLAEVLAADEGAQPDVATAAILSMGLVPLPDGAPPALDAASGEPPRPAPPTASRQAQIAWLLERLDDARLDRQVRAFVPVALARLDAGSEPSSKTRLTDALVPIVRGESKAELQVVHGAVHALGLIGDDDDDLADQRIRAALFKVSAEGDRVARHLALVSLGRVAGRRGEGLAGVSTIEVRSRLTTILMRGQSAQRPWAALALGLLERAQAEAGAPRSEGTFLALRECLENASSPSERGAVVTALGLAGDVESGPKIMKWLTTGDTELRSHAALALGLMRYEPAIPALMETVGAAAYQPSVLRDAAIALALMRHKPVVPLLVAILRDSRFLAVRASAARALALVGDASAIEPLLAVLAEKRAQDSTRAFAAIALGLVCDKAPFPWNSRIAEDLGWFETPATLHDPAQQKGVIDLF